MRDSFVGRILAPTVGLRSVVEGHSQHVLRLEGFSSVRRVPLENPFNILYEIRP